MDAQLIRHLATEAAKTLPIVCCAVLLMSGSVSAASEPKAGGLTPSSSHAKPPKDKQTTLGLYMTAARTYEKWKATPGTVKLIDVRTPEEYAFVGHPGMALNMSFALVTYQTKNGKTEYGPKSNADFVTDVKSTSQPGSRPNSRNDRESLIVPSLGYQFLIPSINIIRYLSHLISTSVSPASG